MKIILCLMALFSMSASAVNQFGHQIKIDLEDRPRSEGRDFYITSETGPEQIVKFKFGRRRNGARRLIDVQIKKENQYYSRRYKMAERKQLYLHEASGLFFKRTENERIVVLGYIMNNERRRTYTNFLKTLNQPQVLGPQVTGDIRGFGSPYTVLPSIHLHDYLTIDADTKSKLVKILGELRLNSFSEKQFNCGFYFIE